MHKVNLKLKLCALFLFALAAALRLEAQEPHSILLYGDAKFTTVHNYGGPADLSGAFGVPAQDSQGNVYVACGTGDPSHYFGGVGKFVAAGDWNGDSVPVNQILHTFGYGDGAYATCLAASGNTLFGATSGGGNNGDGVFFSINGDSTGFLTSSFDANAADTNPNGILVVPTTVANSNAVYVTQQTGGASGMGAVLKQYVSASGGIVTAPPICLFNGDNGQYPFVISADSLFGVRANGVKSNGVKANDNTSTNYTLYGVTLFGGTNAANMNASQNYGTVYKVNNDGSGFQTLYVFSSQRATNGYGPICGLAVSGNTLYGTTSGGGKFGSGTIFKIDTSGSNFMVLKSFSGYGFDSASNLTNSDGEAPEGALILSGDTLYGTTLGGGTNGGGGVVYSINTNGNNFTLLHSFSSPIANGSGVYTNVGGGSTRAGLLLSGHTLFGTTPSGGTFGGGTLFAIILPTPLLNIVPSAGNFTVSWASSATNFMLQQNLTLNSLTWSNFIGAVNDDGTNKSVNIMPASGSAYFRLVSTNGL